MREAASWALADALEAESVVDFSVSDAARFGDGNSVCEPRPASVAVWRFWVCSFAFDGPAKLTGAPDGDCGKDSISI